MKSFAPILTHSDTWQPVMKPYDLIPRTPVRSWFLNEIAGLMNLVFDCLREDDDYGPDHLITWRDELRWQIEGVLEWCHGLFWEGSAEELEIVVEGFMPPQYLNERQLAFYNAFCDFDLGAFPLRILSEPDTDEPLFHCPECDWIGTESELDRDNGILLGGLFSGIKACPECNTMEGHLEELP
jgi:hypothetical protein